MKTMQGNDANDENLEPFPLRDIPVPKGDKLGKRLIDELREKRENRAPRDKTKVKPALAMLLVAVILATAGAGYSGYRLGRAKQIAQFKQLQQELGLDQPVRTEGFAMTGPDTLILTAEINKRSIQRVVFHPLPGENQEVYRAEGPEDGFRVVHAKKTYAPEDRRPEREVSVSV